MPFTKRDTFLVNLNDVLNVELRNKLLINVVISIFHKPPNRMNAAENYLQIILQAAVLNVPAFRETGNK